MWLLFLLLCCSVLTTASAADFAFITEPEGVFADKQKNNQDGAIIRSQVSFTCETNGFNVKTQWYLDTQDDETKMMTEPDCSTDTRCTITFTGKQDKGDYFCVVTDRPTEQTLVSRKAPLQRYTFKNKSDGKLDKGATTETVMLGTNKVLVCVNYDERPTVVPAQDVRYEWLFNTNSPPESEMNMGMDSARHFISDNGNLFIKAFEKADVGFYRCRISHSKITGSRKKPSSQLGLLYNLESTRATVVETPRLRHPSIRGEQTLRVSPGDQLDLECQHFAVPEAKNIWRKDNVLVSAQHWGVLQLKDVTTASAGEYSCAVKGGSAVKKYNVIITPDPIITAVAGPATAFVGDNVTLNCAAEYLKQAPTWYKDGNKLPTSTTAVNNPYALKLSSLVDLHSGMYQCYGDSTWAAHLLKVFPVPPTTTTVIFTTPTTTVAPLTAPEPPTALNVGADVKLSWSQDWGGRPLNTVSSRVHWIKFTSIEQQGDAVRQSKPIPGDVSDYLIPSVPPGLYSFMVSVTSGSSVKNSSWSTQYFVNMPKVIPPPSDVTGRAVSGSVVAVVFEPITEDYVTGYVVKARSQAGSVTLVGVDGSDSDVCLVNNLLADTTYDISVITKTVAPDHPSRPSTHFTVRTLPESAAPALTDLKEKNVIREFVYAVEGRSVQLLSVEEETTSTTRRYTVLSPDSSPPSMTSESSAQLLYIVLAVAVATVFLVLVVVVALCACRHYERKQYSKTAARQQTPNFPTKETLQQLHEKASTANNFLLAQLQPSQTGYTTVTTAAAAYTATTPRSLDQSAESSARQYTANAYGTLPRRAPAPPRHDQYELPAYSTFSRHHARLIKQGRAQASESPDPWTREQRSASPPDHYQAYAPVSSQNGYTPQSNFAHQNGRLPSPGDIPLRQPSYPVQADYAASGSYARVALLSAASDTESSGTVPQMRPISGVSDLPPPPPEVQTPSFLNWDQPAGPGYSTLGTFQTRNGSVPRFC